MDSRDFGCEEFATSLHVLTDLVLAGKSPDERYPGVVAHLRSCSTCAGDLDGLLGAALRQGDMFPSTRLLETLMRDYPQAIAETNRIEPAPRRVRGVLGGEVVFDTSHALFVWEWANYPQYYIPISDVNDRFLVDEEHEQRLSRGSARRHGLRVGDVARPGVARLFTDDSLDGLAGTMRFDWGALDAWFEEDEEVFVHPRNPYTRVDALRSTRPVRIELDGAVLAASDSPVLVFETGLPTRYYFSRTTVNFEHLEATATITACPYKGKTSAYWSIRVGDDLHKDLAWSYDFPTRELFPIAGLVAFYNEKVDVFVAGELLERPITHFFK